MRRINLQVDYAGRDYGKAEKRAEALLKRNLTPTERRQWEDFGKVRVIGPSGIFYRIRLGSGVVAEDPEGFMHHLCVVFDSADLIPPPDLVLAKVLMVKHDERELWRVARRLDQFDAITKKRTLKSRLKGVGVGFRQLLSRAFYL